MSDDGSEQSKSTWPLPKFAFQVKWDTAVIRCMEVSGLHSEPLGTEFNDRVSPDSPPNKAPPPQKYGNVTIKKGLVKADSKFLNSLDPMKTKEIIRVPVTISLLDESGNPTMVWTLTNAFLTHVAGTDIKALGDEIGIETMIVAYEELVFVSSRSAQ